MLISPPNIGDTVKDPELWRQLMDQFFNELTSKLRQVSPAGSLALFATTTYDIPEGWLEADGAEYDQIKYEELYRAIGQTWGGAAGKFKVPTQAECGGAPANMLWIIKV